MMNTLYSSHQCWELLVMYKFLRWKHDSRRWTSVEQGECSFIFHFFFLSCKQFFACNLLTIHHCRKEARWLVQTDTHTLHYTTPHTALHHTHTHTTLHTHCTTLHHTHCTTLHHTRCTTLHHTHTALHYTTNTHTHTAHYNTHTHTHTRTHTHTHTHTHTCSETIFLDLHCTVLHTHTHTHSKLTCLGLAEPKLSF